MSIKNNTTQLQSLLEAVNNLPAAGTGGSEDLNAILEEQEALINELQSTLEGKAAGSGSIELPELTNEATAAELFSGKQLINQEGNKITGTFSIDNELATQDDLITQIQTVVDNLPEAGEGTPALQSKTVTPTTSSQSVEPDSGYDGLSEVTVTAMPIATQATPSIAVSSSGLITASATQSAGYVSAGTKSSTNQLTTQGAQTITPSTTDKIISSGRYLTGTQTIKGDSNLIASNIKNGISIFGVIGTLTETSGGESAAGVCPQLTIIGTDNVEIGDCFYSSNGVYKSTGTGGMGAPQRILNNVDINSIIVIVVYDNAGFWDGSTNENASQMMYDSGSGLLLAKCTAAGENSTIQMIEVEWGWG